MLNFTYKRKEGERVLRLIYPYLMLNTLMCSLLIFLLYNFYIKVEVLSIILTCVMDVKWSNVFEMNLSFV